ncbi:glycosyl transferase family 2 [Gemmobacter aquarius]|uniref:Glycosyl transferase family 2 n=1 Tax=Paragemmobacter aquarius TaxID=2169400 RepID=A0A2S0UMW9_9RHOB|nr:glycosyltransferase [Gemmobacter aquarius]AWB49164.1 glycosyl transferase family 2 [Gemmobacter aquarius]
MRTAVIIPTYNRAAFLPHAIGSVLRQGAVDEIDVIVVDDGSQDGTPAVLAALARDHANLLVVRQANAGVAAARNAGLAALTARHDLVSFLDSDDVMPAGRIAADAAVLRDRPELDLTYGRMLLVDALDYARLAPTEGARRADVVGISLSAALMRRRVIERVGRVDESFRQAEDTDYLLRVFEAGLRFEQTATVCVYYLQHGANMTRDLAEVRRYFVRALHLSVRRRAADPALRLVKPDFALAP